MRYVACLVVLLSGAGCKQSSSGTSTPNEESSDDDSIGLGDSGSEQGADDGRKRLESKTIKVTLKGAKIRLRELEVEIPKGAVEAPISVTISTLDEEPVGAEQDDSEVYLLEPADLLWSEPVEVTLQLNSAPVAPIIVSEEGTGGGPVGLPTTVTSGSNSAEIAVSTQLSSFGTVFVASAVHLIGLPDFEDDPVVVAAYEAGVESGEIRIEVDSTTEDAGSDADELPPLIDCQPGEYIEREANEKRGRTCSKCPGGTFSRKVNAVECVPWTDCEIGEFVAEEPTRTSNRVCSKCSASFSSKPNASACRSWTVCSQNEYEVMGGTRGTDRTCAPITTCPAGQFQAKAPTPTSDRVCTACENGFTTAENATVCTAFTPCTDSEYETQAGTPTGDRLCSALTVCPAGEFVSLAATMTTDRQCSACPAGMFSTVENAETCGPWQTCTADAFETVAPTPTSDRECQTATECAPGQYVEVALSALADRQCVACEYGTFSSEINAPACTPWDDCSEFTDLPYVQAQVPSATQDAICEYCPSGTFTSDLNTCLCFSGEVVLDEDEDGVADQSDCNPVPELSASGAGGAALLVLSALSTILSPRRRRRRATRSSDHQAHS